MTHKKNNIHTETILKQIKDLKKIYNKKNVQLMNVTTKNQKNEKLIKKLSKKALLAESKAHINKSENEQSANEIKEQAVDEKFSQKSVKNDYETQSSDRIFDNLEEQINILILENSRLRADKLKALADLENSKRMMNQEIINMKKFGLTKFVSDLLPVLDNFERAVSVSNESKEVKSFLLGFQMIYKTIKQIFQKDDIEEINVKIGDPYNSHIHNAIEVIETKNAKPNTIIKILQKGYKIKDRVLRPASVNVAK